MSDDRESRRRYGDKEVGLILKRAAELQRGEPASAVEAGGLSLVELEEIASEAGIDPRFISRAAAELDSSASHGPESSILTGAPLSVEIDRAIDGELPPDAFERFVAEIQRFAGGVGQPSVVGRTFTWQSTTPNETRALHVTVSSHSGRTRIRIEERYNNLAGALFGGLLGGVGGGVGLGVGLGVGVGALGSVAFSVLFPAGVFAGSYLLARSIFSAVVRRRRRALRKLMEGLTDEALAALDRPELGP